MYLEMIFESARIPSSRLGSFESIGRVAKSSMQSAICLRMQNITLDESALCSSGRLELKSWKSWTRGVGSFQLGSALLLRFGKPYSGRVGSMQFGSARFLRLSKLGLAESALSGSGRLAWLFSEIFKNWTLKELARIDSSRLRSSGLQNAVWKSRLFLFRVGSIGCSSQNSFSGL